MKLSAFILTYVLFISLSCGEDDAAKGIAGLAGTNWVGQFKGMSEGKAISPVEVSFNFKENKSFKTLSLSNIDKTATGEYIDMPRHNTLLLEVKESTFDAFSLQDTSKSFDYSLEGDELILKSYEGIYTLIRKENDGTDPSNSFLGSWRCNDESDGEWAVDFEDASFFGRRTQANTRALNIWGGVEYLKSNENQKRPDGALITLENANQGEVKGLRLLAEATKIADDVIVNFTMNEILLSGKRKENGLTVKCRKG
jgi:hypothetical protein